MTRQTYQDDKTINTKVIIKKSKNNAFMNNYFFIEKYVNATKFIALNKKFIKYCKLGEIVILSQSNNNSHVFGIITRIKYFPKLRINVSILNTQIKPVTSNFTHFQNTESILYNNSTIKLKKYKSKKLRVLNKEGEVTTYSNNNGKTQYLIFCPYATFVSRINSKH